MSRPGRRVRIIHRPLADVSWVDDLVASGWTVESGPVTGPDDLTRLRARPPDVVVVDLSRAPASGRDVGLALRQYAALRSVPLVFVGGRPAATKQIQQLLPDATCCAAGRVRAALEQLVSGRVPRTAPRPVAAMAGYSGTPLPKKLGIKEGSVVVLVRAPKGFEGTLGQLPADVVLRRRNQGARDLTLWFTRSLRELVSGVKAAARTTGDGRLWIAWPKRTSPMAADHSETDVRRLGLGSGLVDYKICAIDQDWSGLLFARRRR